MEGFSASDGPSRVGLAGGKEKNCSDRLRFLTRIGREPSLWLIGAELGALGREFACDAVKRADGDRIMDSRLRGRLFAMVVARSKEAMHGLPRTRSHPLDQPIIW